MLDIFKERLLSGLRTAEKLGADAAKLSFHHGESLDCAFESGRLKSAGSRETIGYAVQVLAAGRVATTSGNVADDVDLMVERAVTLAKAGSAAHFSAYPHAAPHQQVATYSERTLSLSREQMIRVCQGIVDRLRKRDADLDIQAHCGRREAESILVTSGGVCHENRDTHWSLGAGIQRTRGTDMMFAHSGRSWLDMNDLFDPEYIGDQIETDLDRAENEAPPPRGETVVYLPPSAVGMMLSPVIMGINGRNVAKGTSPLKDKLQQQAFAQNLTLVDNPHIDYCPGAAEIDGDGIPTNRCKLIENGVINMFLYDLDSAGLAGTTPTGHSGCSPYAAELLPGDTPSTDLLASIEDGLYIKSLLGFGQSNIANGDFSSNVALGFRIRNGEITGRVKNTMVAGNIFDVLKADVSLSADRDPVNRMPHMVLRGISAHSSRD
jgi:PmbA protein